MQDYVTAANFESALSSRPTTVPAITRTNRFRTGQYSYQLVPGTHRPTRRTTFARRALTVRGS
jgi:hypothetical protein